MILPYGPVPLTAGIVTFQDVDSSAAWVVVENVSTQLYLGVSFWPSKPPAVAVFNGQPWNVVIQPGGTLRIPCPSQGWLGRIWLLGVDASQLSAATGTISGYSSALLRTYGPDDTPSDSPSVVRGLDILSQPRVVALPPGSQQWTVHDDAVPITGNAFVANSIQLSATNITNGKVEAYMSTLSLQSFATGGGVAAFAIDWLIRDNAAGVLATIPIAHVLLSATGVNQVAEWKRVWPLPLSWDRALPANSYEVTVLVTSLSASTFAGQTIYVHAVWWLDVNNSGSIASPGNQSQHKAPGMLF